MATVQLRRPGPEAAGDGRGGLGHDRPLQEPTGELAGWQTRLGGVPADWLAPTDSSAPSAPVAGQLAGTVDDPRLSRVELAVGGGRLEAVTLYLTDPVGREQLDRLLGPGQQAWMPGAEQTVRWDRPGHRVVAALQAGRVERIWLGP